MKIDKKFGLFLLALVALELVIAPMVYMCFRGGKGCLGSCCKTEE